MQRLLTSWALVVGLMTGCATGPQVKAPGQLRGHYKNFYHRGSGIYSAGWFQNQEADENSYYWGRTTLLALNFRFPDGDPPETWSSKANDTSRKRESRCFAAALLFGGYVHPGFTTRQMRTALLDSRWLDECKLEAAGAVGGRFPFWMEGTHYRLWLFPDAKGHPWSIEFTLSDGANRQERVEEAHQFLKGTHPDRNLRITEFIMMYPLPTFPDSQSASRVEEMHVAWGVGIKIWPGDWFD